ncbi:MAG TPA: 3-isopropylmalate dehydratase [Candidatus Krumholzibacteria bacterium]|nr:3-isopropylmalate dehydratase [Candidatus Krumholzibacteria bacterium]
MNWLFGDNINTDLITPGRYNQTTDPKELAKICFIEYRPEFAPNVKPGDFVVAGRNFGCGSSRETAVTSLSNTGIEAIVAKSFARIFYRNCMNQGLLLLIADTAGIKEQDELELDIDGKCLVNTTQGTKIPVELSPLMLKLREEGGIVAYLKRNGVESLAELAKL